MSSMSSASSTANPGAADFWDKYHAERSTTVKLAPVEPRERERRPVVTRPRRRPIRALLRFLITLGLGVGGTLAWQTYGDTAREMAATTYPEQLGWLMPPPSSAPTTAAAPAVPARAATATVGAAPAPAVDPQQLNAISLGLAGVRRSVEELAAQVNMGQQQMAGDIARLQASEQDILGKIAAPTPPRPAPAPAAARKPAPTPLTLTPAAPPSAAGAH